MQDGGNELENTEDIFERVCVTQAQYIDAHKKLAKKRTVVLKRNPCEL